MSKVQSLTQLLEADDQFSTDVEVEIYGEPAGLPKESYLQHNQKVSIKWQATPSYKSWGMANMYPIVHEQSVSLIFDEPTEGEDKEHEVKIELKDVKTEIVAAGSISSLQFAPIRLEIDLNKNISTVVFQVS